MKKFKYFKVSINLSLARLFNPQLMFRITELDAIDTPSMQQLNGCVRCKARSRWSSREVLKGTGMIQYDTITTRFLGDLFKIRLKNLEIPYDRACCIFYNFSIYCSCCI